MLLSLMLFASIAFAGDPKTLAVGDDAPVFTLKNYDGKQVTLQNVITKNTLTVVMFISTECPISNAYNERMVKLFDDYSKRGVGFVAVNANKAEDIKMIGTHAVDHGFKFPVVKDERNKIADLYGAQVTPETYVINAKGKLLYHGRIDDSRNATKVTSSDLATALTALLDGKTVASATTKAFGCSIKRIAND
jgi:peroxiredoxin